MQIQDFLAHRTYTEWFMHFRDGVEIPASLDTVLLDGDTLVIFQDGRKQAFGYDAAQDKLTMLVRRKTDVHVRV
jgi:hypothetical protein